MAATHATNRKLSDAIFEANKLCKDAIKKFGNDKVTNATIGVVLDEEEKISFLPTVEKVFREMSMPEIISYAPISGLPDYLESVREIIFGRVNYDFRRHRRNSSRHSELRGARRIRFDFRLVLGDLQRHLQRDREKFGDVQTF